MSREPWRLVVSAPALRSLDRLPEKAAIAVIASFDMIAVNPHRVGKPLRLEFEGQHVARRGDYRILYEIDPDERTVTVTRVGHRSDVYRKR